MGSLEQLSNLGWHISPTGYDVISANRTLSNSATITNALNTDIRDFGNPTLVQEMKQTKTGTLVLQIQKIKNVSAPKNKENSSVAPRMLKLTLTDGHTSCQAVEISYISSLSTSNTPPGSKVLLNSAAVSGNYVLLTPQSCKFLGGQVPHLYDKWELTKQVSEQMRSSGEVDGPPPWVNFGEKIVQLQSNQSFKSLVNKEIKQDDFDIQRQDAINVVATGAVKKVFGGGSKTVPLVGSRRPYNNERGYKKRDFKEKNVEVQKAPDKVSLFNFLENKLQTNDNDNKRNHTLPPKSNVDKKKDNVNDAILHAVQRSFEKTSISDNNSGTWRWKIGDLCMAKYWEDNKYYNATVINLTEKTCVVQFNGYGNVEEVVRQDCIPVNCDNNETYKNTRNYYKGSSNYKYKKNFNNR
uniref:Survival of motor neuron-related-splicing factor 30 n=2 Tax=Photinus pyralis TaxID=7054 RepID=A0A1Y1NI80_PHOPY